MSIATRLESIGETPRTLRRPLRAALASLTLAALTSAAAPAPAAAPPTPAVGAHAPAPPDTAAASHPGELCVCADPNNLPFSNRHGEGFENALAEMLARDLGRRLRYVWWPQRRGFIRNTLKAGLCDVVMGVPTGFDLAQPTRPYYRSTYVFVTRRDRHLTLRSLDDPALRRLRIGVHVLGDDYANGPPAQGLANRGIVANVVGYSIYGDYSKPDPPADLIHAVARGDVDVAIAWGPLAGYFAAREPVALEITPLRPDADAAFDIAMAVRRDDRALRDTLDAFIAAHRDEIRQLLHRYGVPLAAGVP